MDSHSLRGQLSLLIVMAATVILLAVGAAIIVLWPNLLLAGIIIGCCSVLVALVGIGRILDRRWVLWFAVPAFALAGLGSIMLAEDLGISRVGELTEVVVVDHTSEVKTVHDSTDPGGRKVYTHEYTLQHTDGSPIEEPMIYRGKDGFEEFDTGDTISVLIGADGNAPIEPAESIDFADDIAILVVGVLLSAGVYLMCALLLLFGNRRYREDRWGAAPWMMD
ncbi:hypothetical protein CIK58_00135 [Brevibacterium aurantiacum]|uniref:DUF3592 domain-containing protein n=1 Tax=Brevibacterium aurantiacum TaxID=273384 RepID=A0A2H1J7J9_BREAU|nr:hypothetical protein [Brevibacterium aurantiacum]PCC58800.1 hypothetical protein CIK58_00135 [Brevibacterium aurantiacum]GEB23326.1 hypothetical protein BAU01nite_20590 [Brevibacterium aurantiacum]SMX83373.1 hypothetical protein BAUR9175_02129 [Brevibacterium aurantiacum]